MSQHLQGEDASVSLSRGHRGAYPRWRHLPHAPRAWHRAVGIPGHPEPGLHAEGSSLIWGQRWEKWEGTTLLAKARQPGWVRLAGLSIASPSLAHPHVSVSMHNFGGQVDRRRGRAECACKQGLVLEELQLLGEAAGQAGAPSGSRCHACSCYAPAPGAPSRHILRIPRKRPALTPPRDTACLPRQPLLGAKQFPMTLSPAATALAACGKPPGAFAKEKLRGVPKATATVKAHGRSADLGCVCSPKRSPQQ